MRILKKSVGVVLLNFAMWAFASLIFAAAYVLVGGRIFDLDVSPYWDAYRAIFWAGFIIDTLWDLIKVFNASDSVGSYVGNSWYENRWH